MPEVVGVHFKTSHDGRCRCGGQGRMCCDSVIGQDHQSVCPDFGDVTRRKVEARRAAERRLNAELFSS